MIKKRSLYKKIIIVSAVIVMCVAFVRCFSRGDLVARTSQDAVLALDLTGVIIGKSQFLKDLREHIKDTKIKGVLVRLDSPGGSVALSQEIYHEFKMIRDKLKKPVVVSVGSIMASGGLYAASGATSIVVNEGTLVGSIGVVVPLVNMERLYNWAKVEPYSIKTGEFKELGSNYRPMTNRERNLFQDIADEMLEQFKKAIVEGRNMSPDELEPYTDARIFSGETAVSAGFADSIGTYTDAVKLIGELTGLGEDVELFRPKRSYFSLFSRGLSSRFEPKQNIFSFFISQLKMNAKPMYIFPPTIGM